MILVRCSTSLSILLCALSFGCKRAHTRADTSPDEPARLPDYVRLEPGAPLTISPPLIPPPPWLETTSTQLVTPRLGPGAMIVFGDRVSLHRTPLGMIAVHAEEGVIGPVALPEESTWVGVDGEDRIWVGRHRDGALFRARSAREASTPQGFETIKTIEGARAWDASGAYIVVATEQAIFVSDDHGATWKERRVKDLDRILQVYVRGDGVLVAQGESEASRQLAEDLPSTWISTTRGISWVKSPYQPGKLERDGTWIWSGDSTCVATLTADGKAWSANPDLRDLPGNKDPREQMLSLTYELHAPAGQDRIAATSTPGAPAHEGPLHEGLVASCQDPIMSDVQARPAEHMMQGAERGPRLEICEQISCLRGYMPSPTRAAHESYLLADARCDWPEGVSAQRDPGCKAEGAKVTRAPHTVLWDRLEDTMTLGDVPGGCTPEKILNSRGLHVLLCRAQGTTEVWTRTAKTPWAHEAVLEVAASRVAGISSSEDGTVVLHGECDTTGCAPSHIRQPRASGVLDVWAAIDVPQSLTVLPLLAGNALVASQRGDQTSALQLWLVEEGKSLLFLTEVPRINEPLYAISMTDTSRQIALHPGDPLTTKTSVVQGDGTLLAP